MRTCAPFVNRNERSGLFSAQVLRAERGGAHLIDAQSSVDHFRMPSATTPVCLSGLGTVSSRSIYMDRDSVPLGPTRLQVSHLRLETCGGNGACVTAILHSVPNFSSLSHVLDGERCAIRTDGPLLMPHHVPVFRIQCF